MKSFYLFVLLLLSVSAQMLGSSTPREKQQQLSDNGVSITDDSKTYTDHQYYLLSSFDFNPYRNFTTKRTVQIEDGPMIELNSVTEMLQAGKNIPAEITERKRNEIIPATPVKSVITLINIGFRYGPKKNTETGF